MQPTATSTTKLNRSPRARRVLLVSFVGLLLLGGISAAAFLFLQHQRELHTGHWVAVATVMPGQPTPTVPPGAFAFKDVGGRTVIYFPPAEAPVAITWQTYQDSQHGYRLEIPGNWTTLDQSPTLTGARMVCPPGADQQDDVPGSPACVTYGWVSKFTPPPTSDPTVANPHTVMAGNVKGTLYTESALGTIITAVFPYEGRDVVITTFGNSDALMYAFQHMFVSLTFS